jgi:hypothetical protein
LRITVTSPQYSRHILGRSSIPRRQPEEAGMMNQGYHQFAEALVFVHGPAAEAEAVRHAILCENLGDTEIAETWRRVQSAVSLMSIKKAA